MRVRLGDDLFRREPPGHETFAEEMPVALSAVEVAPDLVGECLNFEVGIWKSGL